MLRRNSYIDPAVVAKKEEEALVLFKERIPDLLANFSDYKRQDAWLLRWLRARELDITKSEEMLRNSLEWRAKENIDTIFEWTVPDFFYDEYPIKAAGFDKDGSVIAIIPFGRWDIRKVMALGMKSEFVRYIDLLFEQVMRFIEIKSKEGSVVTQFNVIFDLDGLTLGQITCRQTIEVILECIRRFEANHPESLKVGWLVNVPKIFEVLFALIKPIMTARTLCKVRVHGSGGDWRPLLLSNIEPHQLPSQYGGSNTSCPNYKVHYGFDVFPVLEEFPEKSFIPVTVDAGTKHVVGVFLEKGNKLSWNFRTEHYDIGFIVTFSELNDAAEFKGQPEGATDVVMFECARTDSHIHTQKGGLVAVKPGTYSLIFDNSFSRFRGKNIFYCTRLT